MITEPRHHESSVLILLEFAFTVLRKLLMSLFRKGIASVSSFQR